ncbi:two-component sensor histidine kinase [Candidatus Moduliflexus flocculans]|uniref:histidine kinase n=1 Tax=Candidatus Moduliflexus flocculans TaxID=1499966 RepID=A0A0S6VU35_9BACT|nr:two-component sensor histidine kinase [Candidatus Moduliflexus flocculans]
MFDVIPIARAQLIEHLPDGMIVFDSEARIVDINPAAAQIFGQPIAQLIGRTLATIAPEHHGWKQMFDAPHDIHTEIALSNGDAPREYDARLSLLYDEPRREVIGRLLILRDITARKRSEDALRASQDELTASLRREQQRRIVSETLREAATIISSTLEPRRVIGLLLDELQKVVAYHFVSVMLEHEGQLTRVVRRSERGDSYHPLTFAVNAYPLNAQVLSEKRPVVIPDVSVDERWKTSGETRVIRSLMNMPLLVQDRPIGVLTVGRADDIPYTDEDAAIVFAFASHVAVSLENARLADRTRQALIEVQDMVERLQRTQKRLVESEKLAALGKLVANVAHEINTPIGAIKASAGNILAALDETLRALPVVLRDIHPEQHALFISLITRALQEKQLLTTAEERRFRRALCQELEDADLAQADEMADMLVDMGIYAQIDEFLPLLRQDSQMALLRSAYTLAAQQHHSHNIISAVSRAMKVISALKTYAHLDMIGDMSAANIPDGIDIALTLYQNQLKQGIEVVKRYADIPLISGYPDDLVQVWTNLIHNAIQAMQGKGRLEIAVSQHQPPPSQEGSSPVESSTPIPLLGGTRGRSFVVVAITDSGPGIPDAIKDRIFEPFFTTKPAGEGSGLGLDISRKIIEKHQGKIEFDSKPGRTTFRVWLPVS